METMSSHFLTQRPYLPKFQGADSSKTLKTGFGNDRLDEWVTVDELNQPYPIDEWVAVDELNQPYPIDTVGQVTTSEHSEQLTKTRQTQIDQLITGLSQGIDVIFQNSAWRNQFIESKTLQGTHENIFDQLSSVWNLTVARFKEACPTDGQETALENFPSRDNEESLESSQALATTPAPPFKSQPHYNPEAFENYQKVILKYPDIALKQAAELPFDLGAQAASVAQNPDQVKINLDNFRHQKLTLDQKIKKEAQTKQLKGEAVRVHQSAALKQALPEILAGVKTLFETPKSECEAASTPSKTKRE